MSDEGGSYCNMEKESEYRLGAGFRKVGGPIPGLLLADKGERSPPTEKGGPTSPGRWSNLKWWECTSGEVPGRYLPNPVVHACMHIRRCAHATS